MGTCRPAYQPRQEGLLPSHRNQPGRHLGAGSQFQHPLRLLPGWGVGTLLPLLWAGRRCLPSLSTPILPSWTTRSLRRQQPLPPYGASEESQRRRRILSAWEGVWVSLLSLRLRLNHKQARRSLAGALAQLQCLLLHPWRSIQGCALGLRFSGRCAGLRLRGTLLPVQPQLQGRGLWGRPPGHLRWCRCNARLSLLRLFCLPMTWRPSPRKSSLPGVFQLPRLLVRCASRTLRIGTSKRPGGKPEAIPRSVLPGHSATGSEDWYSSVLFIHWHY